MNKIKFVKLTVTLQEGGYAVAGTDTFELKGQIKAAGGKWSPTTKSWVIPHASIDIMREVAESLSEARQTEKKVCKERKAQMKASDTAIAQKAKDAVLDALEKKKATGEYSWICCEKCIVIDWARQHTSCDACAKDNGLYKDTFRVRGLLYTGD